jgi:hydroxymethylglutaryl-CoA reductase
MVCVASKQKIQESEHMIGLMMRTTMIVGAVAYATGVFESSWRHYFHRYTTEQDRVTTGLVQEVKVIEVPKITKSRGGKK